MRQNGNREDVNRRQYGIKPYEPLDLPPSPYIRYPDYGPEEEVHLRDYLGVLMKRKWVVVVFLISVMSATVFFTCMEIPLYKSAVVMKIDQDGHNALSLSGLPVAHSGADYYVTQYEILKSQSLAERVIRKLELGKNKDFLPLENGLSKAKGSVTKAVSGIVSLVVPSRPSTGPAQQSSEGPSVEQGIPLYLINSLIGRLEVTPVKNSQLVKVSFSSHNPGLAANVVKTVAEEYIGYDLESRIEATREAKEFLQKQIELTRIKVENSEKKLNAYASRNEIIFLDNEKQSVITQKLSEISAALSGATTERMQKEALLREIRESGAENPTVLNNSLIQGLKGQHAALEAEYFNLSKTYTPDYPKMKSLQAQVDAVRNRIELEKNHIVRSLESDYSAVLKKEASLKDAFGKQQRRVLDFQGRAAEYQILKREVEVNKQLHNNLLQRLNEVGVAAMSKASNIQVVDRARYPRAPYKPTTTQNILLSIVFGLAGGIGLAFLIDYFDNTVKDTQEIEKKTHLPTLGMVPFQKNLHSSKRPLIVHTDAKNPVAEVFRSIGTFILLSSSVKPPKTILVTSPGEKEGKTTVCMNISSALAESLGNGIIIDADLRRPRLHHSFEVDNKIGLSSCLSGNIDFEGAGSALIKPTSVKGLSVITSGPLPPNPTELLYSSRMKALLESLCSLFNFVLIDASPALGMPDSLFLSSVVDGTILVVKAGTTPRDALAAANKLFKDVDSKLLGIVLNGVRKNDLRYGNYSYYYSSYFKE